MDRFPAPFAGKRPMGVLGVLRAVAGLAWLIPLWFSLHGTAAQAQAACTQVAVLNHPTYNAFRTNSATGSCTLPSGIVMSWNHVGANRGLTSFGCSSYDPTYWMDGGTMTVTFSQAVNDVGFIMWGLDGTDSAVVAVGSGTTAPPTVLANEFTDPCPGQGAGSPPTVVGDTVQGTGGAFFGQIGVRASNGTPYTVLSLTITGSGGGFGLVAVGSPVPIAPPGPPPQVTVENVPALSTYGIGALILLMAAAAFWAVRRRHR
ncbi:MAG TPA: IPTL-CTERM sorting domain-containing protein [Gemmatimonadaceae bacterium]|jgi:hypothetical protein|nr:IPTL-CTERM sorting domain-containing protein [Gemmatimonadaceae bacterium]